MTRASVWKDSLAPLVLRLALAAILLVHGWDKVTGRGNDWGTTWAINFYVAQRTPPPDVLDKLDRLPNVDPEDLANVKYKLGEVYSKDAPHLPATLQVFGVQLAVAWGELVAGVTLLLGLLTRLSALGVIVIQAGAIWAITLAKGFSFAGGGGYEYNIALLAMCLSLVLSGAGGLSVDRCLWGRRDRAAAPSAAAAAGATEAPVGAAAHG